MTKRFILFTLIFFVTYLAKAQNCGLDAPLPILPNQTHFYEFEIFDVVNDDLSSPDQGVCGIEIFFGHNYISDLELWIISPSGQSVQLIGPNTDAFDAFTIGGLWNIEFVACGDPADPDFPYASNWNNAINDFIPVGNFDGSYYPIVGCLEDFNFGSVNGTWTIQVVNNPTAAFIPGQIFDFRLVLCDDTGQNCCFAEAGDLEGYDLVEACQGDSLLILDQVSPTFGFTENEADSIDYGYTYAIGQDGIFVGYDSLLDLRAYDAGFYEICGFSYKRMDSTLFVMSDGILTLNELRDTVNSPTPPLCAEMSDSCVQVRIFEVPDPTPLTDSICAGDTYMLGDSIFSLSGNYDVVLSTINGCDSLIDLELVVLDIPIVDLDSTICEGESVIIGSSIYSTTGNYSDTLSNFFGCDSIVNLNLNILAPVDTAFTAYICEGDSYTIGSSTYTEMGTYRDTLVSSLGCDSIVDLILDVLELEVVFATPDTISCAFPEISIDGSASTANGTLMFEWTNLAGDSFGDSQMALVNTPGQYILTISQTEDTTTCFAQDTITVFENVLDPIADAGSLDSITCQEPTIILGGDDTSVGSNFAYQWTSSLGNFVSSTTESTTEVDATGIYILEVTDTNNGCIDSSAVVVAVDTIPPIAIAETGIILNCDITQDTIFSTGSSMGEDFAYQWTGLCILSSPDSSWIIVDCPGDYNLQVTNIVNGCFSTTSTTVDIDTIAPEIMVTPPPFLNCEVLELDLETMVSNGGSSFEINWAVSNGGNIVDNANSLTPNIDQTGTYTLTVTNPDNTCSASIDIVVQDTITNPMSDAGLGGVLTCADTSLILDGSNSTMAENVIVSWSTLTGNILSDTSQYTIEIDAPGIYALTVIDTFTLCSDVSGVSVQQDTISPIAEAGDGFTLNCTVSDGILDGTASEQGPNIVYQWTGPCILSDDQQPTIQVDCAGMYYLEVRNTATACFAIDSVFVGEDFSQPIAMIDATELITCLQEEITIDATASSQSDRLVYEWTGPSIVSNGDSINPVVNQAGEYTLIITDTISNCADTASVMVDSYTFQPVADAGPDAVINCQDSIVEIGTANTSIGLNMVYEWFSSESGILSGADSTFAMVDTAGVFVLFATDTLSGCVDTSFVTITEDLSIPFVNAGADIEIDCSVENVNLDANISGAGTTNTVQWTGECIDSDPMLAQIEISCPDTYYISVTNLENFCVGVDSVVVSFDSLAPFAELDIITQVSCETGEATIDGSASSSGFYQWFFEGSPINGTQNMLVVDQLGTYELVVSNLDMSCSDTASTEVVLDCAPEIIIANPDTISCLVPTIMLDASATSSAGPITYGWTTDDMSCILEGEDTATPTVQCGGEYTLIATNTEVNQSDTLTIIVPIDTISPVANAGMNDTINCAQPFAILDGSLSSVGVDYTYAWSQSFFDVFSTQIQDTIFDAGTYLLTVTDTTNGCSSQDVVTIIDLRVDPTIAFSSELFPCNADTFSIQGVVSPPSLDYVYNWTGQGIISLNDESSILIDTAGTFILSVIDTANECSIINTIEVVEQICLTCVEILPPDTISCNVDSITLEASYCLPCIDCEIEWTSVGGTINSGENTLTPVVSSGGIYEIAVTDTLGQVTVFSVTVIEDIEEPISDAGPDRLLTCDSTSVTLSGNGLSMGSNFIYEWMALSGNTPMPNNNAFLIANQVDTFVLMVTNLENGCQSMDTVIVEEDLVDPIADAGIEQALTCDNDLIILEGGGSSLGLIYEYEWTSANGVNVSGANTINPIVTEPDTYYLSVRDTTNGCIAIDSVLVNGLFDDPVFDSLINQIINCQDTIAFLSTSIEEDPLFTYSYEWCLLDEMDQVVLCTDTALTIQVDSANRWRFEVVNDSTGCSNNQIVEVLEDIEVPFAEAGEDVTLLCTQDSIQLNGVGDAMGNDFTINWTSDDGQQISNDTILDPTVYEPGTYFLSILNENNFCATLDSVQVLVDENIPEVEAGNDSLLTCNQIEIDLSATIMTESGNANIQWFNEDNLPIQNPTTATPTINEPGIYYVSVTDPNNFCTSIDSLQILENINQPTAMIDTTVGLLLNCFMDTLSLNATASMTADSGEVIFAWQTIGGNIIGMTTDSIIEVNQAGSYQLEIIDSFNGCRDTINLEISEDFTLPTIVFLEPDTLNCVQNIVTIDASNSIPNQDVSYQWERADGSVIVSDTFPSLEVSDAGFYTLMMTNLINGCSAVDSQLVSIDTIAPIANIQAVNNLDCDTREVDLIGVGSSVGSNISYVWFANPGQIIGPIDSIATIANMAGNYSLQVINNENGCIDEESINVIAEEAPILGIEYEVAIPTCIDDTDGFINILNVEGGTFPFLYAIDGAAYSNQSEWINLGAGAYTVSILDANGCEWTEEIIVDAPEEIVVDLGVDLTIELGDSARLEAIVNIPYDTLIWMPVDSFEDSSNPIQVVQPNEASYYTVMVTDENGCIARDTIVVFVDKPRTIFVPTAFSPNDDGTNDVFMIFAGRDVKEIKSFMIFDRWGNQVFGREKFQPNDPIYGWDGNFNGQKMNSAVYVYFVEYEFVDGWVEILKGDVLLKR